MPQRASCLVWELGPPLFIVSERWSFYIFPVHGGGGGGKDGGEKRAGGATRHTFSLPRLRCFIVEFTQPMANTCHRHCRGDNERRPSVEVGVPYQAGTEAATAAAVNGDGPPAPPPPPVGPLDNVWMAHLLPSAKTSAESRVQRSRDRATAKRSNFLVVMESDCSCT